MLPWHYYTDEAQRRAGCDNLVEISKSELRRVRAAATRLRSEVRGPHMQEEFM